MPSLPGCISEGDTVDEAMRNIREAIELYLEPVEDDFVAKVSSESVIRTSVPAATWLDRSPA
jgi:predicted RNase H-like HicB family nuclease